MSVWETTTYKLEVARAIYTYLPGYCEKIFGPTASGYLHPRGDMVPICREDSWDDIADILRWDNSVADTFGLEDVNELTKGTHKWLVGVHGIYALVHAIRKGHFTVSPQYNYTKMDEKLRALGSVVCASTMVTPASFTNRWQRADNVLVEQSRKFEDCAEALKFAARFIDTRSNAYKPIDQGKFFGHGSRRYYGGSIGTLVILRGSAFYTDRCIVLTRTHLDILISVCLRISGILDHTAREHFENPDLKARISKMLDLTINSAFNCGRRDVDKIVQAFHKARAFIQMQLFENEMVGANNEALLEFQKKGLHNILNIEDYMKLFIGVPKGKWLELLHIYKWMPPPDFDATYAFTELYEHHMSTRPSALDSLVSPEAQELWKLVVRERKLNIACAYRKIHKGWPESLPLTEGNPEEEDLDAWEPVALFPYFTYGKDVSAQIKDKATVMARLDDEVHATGRVYEKNFLLWYLLNHESVDTTKLAGNLAGGGIGEDSYVRVAYKGEAHKPGSRLFFMAPPRQRILLGELEGNISRIASQYPGSLQGIDSLTRAERLAKLFSLEQSTLAVEESDIFTCYIVTFDLSKFSPRFNPSVLQDLHRFWAKVFGYDPIEAMGRIGATSTILHTTNGLVMQYENKGADLEGFRGRMMTLFHADLIAAACRYAKNKGYILGKAQSAVFIDDGAVKIAAVGRDVVAKKNALGFLKCMQAVYEVAGQENHPNKTIVSSIGGELLAEQFVYGQKIKCPIKAAMRLYPSYELKAACITEEFNALFSTSQGSVKDGADWVCAYRRLAEGYMKAIFRWCRRDFDRTSALRMAFRVATPKSLGGFGFPTLQALTSTTAYDMTSEGLGILNSAARMYPGYEAEVKLVLNHPVVVRDALQLLRDPGRVRFDVPVLVEGRVASAILKQLSNKNGPWSKFIGLVQNEDLIAHATAVAEALLSRDTVSIPVLKRAWDCTPLAYVEGIVQKFKRSSSVQLLLTEKDIGCIRGQNRKDVVKLVQICF